MRTKAMKTTSSTHFRTSTQKPVFGKILHLKCLIGKHCWQPVLTIWERHEYAELKRSAQKHSEHKLFSRKRYESGCWRIWLSKCGLMSNTRCHNDNTIYHCDVYPDFTCNPCNKMCSSASGLTPNNILILMLQVARNLAKSYGLKERVIFWTNESLKTTLAARESIMKS